MKKIDNVEFSLSEQQALELKSKIAVKNPTYSSNFEGIKFQKAIEQINSNPEAVNNFKAQIPSERLQELIETQKNSVEYKKMNTLINKFNNNEGLSADDQKNLSSKIQNFSEKLSEKIQEQEGVVIPPEVLQDIAINMNKKEEMGQKANIDELEVDPKTKEQIAKIMKDPQKSQELMEKISHTRKLRS